MNNLIHIQTVRHIEYGAAGFNWQVNELQKLLAHTGCDIKETLNDDCVGDWEIEETEFQEAVKKISAMNKDEIASFFRNDDQFWKHEDIVGRDTEAFRNEVIEMLKKFADTGDHSSGYYHFSWF